MFERKENVGCVLPRGDVRIQDATSCINGVKPVRISFIASSDAEVATTCRNAAHENERGDLSHKLKSKVTGPYGNDCSG